METVARHVLVDLAYQNLWDLWLRSKDYGRTETEHNDWRSIGWRGDTSYERTFDEWVRFYDYRKDRFQVSARFIERMHFWDAEYDPPETFALAMSFGLPLKHRVGNDAMTDDADTVCDDADDTGDPPICEVCRGSGIAGSHRPDDVGPHTICVTCRGRGIIGDDAD